MNERMKKLCLQKIAKSQNSKIAWTKLYMSVWTNLPHWLHLHEFILFLHKIMQKYPSACEQRTVNSEQ